MEYNLKGTLHNKQWFLENGWINIENVITNDEFESVILLKEINPETNNFGYDLQCKSKLYYKDKP